MKKRKGLPFLIALGGALLLYVLEATAQGFIGDFASNVLFPNVMNLLTLTQWPPFLVPGLLVAMGISIWVSWWIFRTKTRELESATTVFDKLIELDRHTILSMRRMTSACKISADDLNEVTKKLMRALLGIAAQMFGKDVYAGACFRVDKNVLKIWAEYQMLQEDMENMQFDMSQAIRSPIGMARAAYQYGTTEVGRIEIKGKLWWCTNEHYIKTTTPLELKLSEAPKPLYASLICVPVIHESQQEPLGVIAFHSSERTTFDDEEINHLVEQAVNRITQALVLYDLLCGAEQSTRHVTMPSNI